MQVSFKRLNRMQVFAAATGLFLALAPACKKKERLAASTFNFSITPPSTSILQTDALTLNAKGQSSSGNVDVSPSWTVSPTTLGTLNTSIGPTVVFQPTGLGDVVISATYDGITATSQIAIVTYKPSGNTFDVYNDIGLPTGGDVNSDIFTSGSFLHELSSGYTPEGTKYQRASETATGFFWGVTLDKATAGKRKNLSDFNAGTVKFALRLDRAMIGGESLRIEITDNSGTAIAYTLSSGSDGFNRLSTDWQEISLSIAGRFPGLNTASIKVPFAIVTGAATTPLTYDVDAVRWEK